MKRKTLLFLFFIMIISENVLGQEAERKPWIQAIREATIALGTVRSAKIQTLEGEVTKNIFAVVGTGVLFAAPDHSIEVPFLVTAKHVFYDPKNNWEPDSLQIRFSWSDQKPVDEYLGVTLKLKEGVKRIWFPHPDSQVDLAAIPLLIQVEEAGRAMVIPIPLSNFAEDKDVFEGALIQAFGYPGAVGPAFWTRSIVRTGIIAWINPQKPLNNTFLIDSLVFPGNSGGPVFRLPTGVDQFGKFTTGGKIAFLGIISQGRKEESPLLADGKQIDLQGPQGAVKIIIQQWIGIGVVEPASRVKQLLEYVVEQIKK